MLLLRHPPPQKSLPKSAASTSGAATNLNDAVEDPENAPQAPTTPSSSSSSPPTTTSSGATSTMPSPLPKNAPVVRANSPLHSTDHGFDATVYADLIIDVVEEGRTVPVACISLVIRGSGLAKLLGNNLAGSVELDDFVMSLKWSNIGNLHLFLIQPVMWTLLQTVFLPYANAILGKGFPLPIIHGFTLENAELVYSNSRVTVCGDVQYTK